MQTIGLIGGMSWQSSQLYYRLINQTIAESLGGLHSAELIMHSVDFEPIEALQRAGEWALMGQRLGQIGHTLAAAGADFLVLATNTMHKVADSIEAAAGVPLLHIADATAQAVEQQEIERVGLLGTRFTMEEDFYRARLEAAGLEVITPDSAARREVDRIIFEELCCGRIEASSRAHYRRVSEALVADGAQGVILGCTEIGLLIGPDDVPVPVFDTAAIHARRAALLAID